MLHLRIAYSTCTRSLVVKEFSKLAKKSHLLSTSRTCNVNLKWFSVSTQSLAGDKPVILSAADILKNEGDKFIPYPGYVDPSVTDKLASNLPDPNFADLGLATSWWPSHIVEGLLESFHLSSGLPWWGTIVIGTFVLRLVTLPVFISSRKTSVRFTSHMPEVSKLRTRMMDAIAGKDMQKKFRARKQYQDYVKTNKIQMWRMVTVAGAMPVMFVACMRALNELAALPLPSLHASSFLWIASLSSPDPYRLLPFLAGSVVGLNVYAAVKLGATAALSEGMQRNVKYFALLPPIIMPLVFGGWSSTVGLYILVNSCVTVAITVLLKVKAIETALNMPVPARRADGKAGNPIMKLLKDSVSTARDKTSLKIEKKEIQKMLRTEKKARKKELKRSPPLLFTIGSEATLKKEDIPDFKKDWRPPRINVYEQ